VREWIAELSASGLAPTTVHKCSQILAKIMRAAVDAGLLVSSPCERQPLPKVERDEMRFLAPDEVARLADVIIPAYRPLVLLGAYGGLRAGEMFGLRRGRLDVLHATVDVAEVLVEVNGHHHFGPPKTRAGRRRVPLPRFVVDAINQHVGALAPEELVFPAPRGGPVRASLFRRRTWHPAVEAAALTPLRIHDLRHTAVALWIAAGASPKEIAARAGHTSVATVLDRYGHLYAGHETAVVEALDAMARGAHAVHDADVQPLPARKGTR
jgi:integrase